MRKDVFLRVVLQSIITNFLLAIPILVLLEQSELELDSQWVLCLRELGVSS